MLSKEAGIEFPHIERLADLSVYDRLDGFDSLLVKVTREDGSSEPEVVIDSIQSLCDQVMYVPTCVTRFKFENLKKMIGDDHEQFDFFYEAYHGVHWDLEIPDDRSFRRLLVAIARFGLPTYPRGSPMHDHTGLRDRSQDHVDPVPVLRFFARLKGSPPQNAQLTWERPDNRDEDVEMDDTPSRPPRRHRIHAPQHLMEEDTRGGTPGPSSRPMGAIPEDSPEGMAGLEFGPVGGSSSSAALGQETIAEPRNQQQEQQQQQQGQGQDQQQQQPEQQPEPQPEQQPEEQPEEELTFEDRAAVNELDFALSNTKGNHVEDYHNLYADIAARDRRMRDPGNKAHEYQPPYSSIRLSPHQTYLAGWMMGDSKRILHYLADKPGVGKTFGALEACIRISLILSNDIMIQREREALPTTQARPLHMHPDYPANKTCRAGTLARLGFVCSCDPESPTYEFVERRHYEPGYILISAPIKATTQWYNEVRRFLKTTVRLPHSGRQFQVLDIHDDGNEGDGPGNRFKEFMLGGRAHYGLGSICIIPMTGTVKSTLEYLEDNPNQALRQQPSFIVVDEMHALKSVTLTVRLIHELIRRSMYNVHVLALSGSPMETKPGDLDIIQGIAVKDSFSFGNWYGERTYNAYNDTLLSAREELNDGARKLLRSGLIGSGAAARLSEEEKREGLEVLNSYDRLFRRYAAALGMIQRKELGDYLGYTIPLSQPPHGPTQYLRCDWGMNEMQKRIANGYKLFLRTRYRHKVRVWSRRAEETRGPKPTMRDMLFRLDDAGGLMPNPARLDTSLIGFTPGLAARVLQRGPDEFRTEEVNKIFKGTTPTGSQRRAVINSPYWNLAVSAFQKENPGTGDMELHPKVVQICRIIDIMLQDNSQHKGRAEKGLAPIPKKMIICVPHPWHGYILMAYLLRQYTDRNFTFLGSGSTQSQRDKLLAPFTRATDQFDAADSQRNDPIILISTYNLMGTSLNLTRCSYAISTSPLASSTWESQFFARVNRRGQGAETHCYVLVDNGNPVDVTTYQRMQERTALTVPEDEIGGGLDFLLENIDEAEEEEVDTGFNSGQEDSGSD